jgi:molybdate transport system substrate-binding protein
MEPAVAQCGATGCAPNRPEGARRYACRPTAFPEPEMPPSSIVAVAALAFALPAAAAEIRVLSAGAVEPGLKAFGAVVERQTRHRLSTQFNTAPQIAKRLAAGESYDLLIAPPGVLDQALKDGRIVGETRVPVGRVGAGIVVRTGNPLPNVADVEALKKMLGDADRVVYNTASTGLYLDRLFERLGILDAIKAKSTRYPDGASVLEHVARGKGNEVGFGAITEIRIYEPKGLSYVGPLPADVQNYTSYEAAVMTGATNAAPARAALKLLGTPEGKSAFVSAGVE